MEAGGRRVPLPRNSAEPCRGLLEVAPLVADYMQPTETTALRRTCREGRAIADATMTINSLAVEFLQRGETQWTDVRMGAQQVAAFVRGILSRGARLKKLTLHPVVGDVPCINERRDAPENEHAA